MNANGNDSRIILPRSQFLQSCRILFGPEVSISRQFLTYLQPAGIKSAYRRLAMETHPDRSCYTGLDEATLEERFKEVNRAYEQVSSYILQPDRFILTLSPNLYVRAYRPAAARPAAREHHYAYRGEIPTRKIFIGQFLYYSGVISMRQMWSAVGWQKIRRPRLGDIARELGWLDPSDIENFMRFRRPGELFGEFALRKGWLNFYQILVLLGRQKRIQPRIGDYFIERGILLPGQLNAAEEALREHNRRYWFNRG
jgi:hypothetical protein